MIKTEPPKPVPLPVLLVYGKPARSDFPQAAWFHIEDRSIVLPAAESLKLAVADIKADADQQLLEGVYEGVLKGSGRMILGSVSAEVYRRLEAHATATGAAPTQALATPKEAKEEGRLEKEQNVNLSSASAPSASNAGTAAAPGHPAPGAAPSAAADAKDPWRQLRIGAHVVAKFWETSGEPGGWWVAIVTDVGNDGFVARWLDEPLKPGFRIDAKHVALLHPSYDPSREWDRKR